MLPLRPTYTGKDFKHHSLNVPTNDLCEYVYINQMPIIYGTPGGDGGKTSKKRKCIRTLLYLKIYLMTNL